MAWALSQILVVCSANVARSGEQEFWHIWFDIFVRNAFTDYGKLLKEVSYAPAMGAMLTYHGSKSKDYDGTFPDENFAREIMQLFSVGLWVLNEDGTRVTTTDGTTDEGGDYIPTYDNADIMNFARGALGENMVVVRMDTPKLSLLSLFANILNVVFNFYFASSKTS